MEAAKGKALAMEDGGAHLTTIDEYIEQFPEDVQRILIKIRTVIKESAPGAVEKISYRMPSFHLNGVLAYFGVHTHHIGFYPTASGIAAFKEQLSAYKGAKGSVQFPLSKPVPYELISRIVKFKAEENLRASARS